MNVSLIVNFCLDKYSYSLDTFWTQLIYVIEFYSEINTWIIIKLYNTFRFNEDDVLKFMDTQKISCTTHIHSET